VGRGSGRRSRRAAQNWRRSQLRVITMSREVGIVGWHSPITTYVFS
jgi:hypothetical protein